MTPTYDTATIDELAKAYGHQIIEDIFDKLGLQFGRNYLAKAEQINHTRNLLNQRLPRYIIVQRLMIKYMFSERTAQNRITEALHTKTQ